MSNASRDIRLTFIRLIEILSSKRQNTGGLWGVERERNKISFMKKNLFLYLDFNCSIKILRVLQLKKISQRFFYYYQQFLRKLFYSSFFFFSYKIKISMHGRKKNYVKRKIFINFFFTWAHVCVTTQSSWTNWHSIRVSFKNFEAINLICIRKVVSLAVFYFIIKKFILEDI